MLQVSLSEFQVDTSQFSTALVWNVREFVRVQVKPKSRDVYEYNKSRRRHSKKVVPYEGPQALADGH